MPKKMRLRTSGWVAVAVGHRLLPQGDLRTAQRVPRDWLARARACGIRILSKLGDTLAEYRESILAYYDCRISTGPLEGTNNKIQLMNRQAYGFRDQEFFKLNILGILNERFRRHPRGTT
jgi:transposase